MGDVQRLIDTSVFGGCWPFRALPNREPGQLKADLSGRGVSEAWIASSEAILYPDPMQGNIPLFQSVRGDVFYKPVAMIDPSLATWKSDAHECISNWNCVAVKITPNYHQIDVTDHRIQELAHFCGEINVRCVFKCG